MSLMEAKSDILQECKIKFLHTFQVRFETQKSGHKDYTCICFVLSDFMWILATGTICEFYVSSAVFTSNIRQYRFLLLDQYSLLFKKRTCY